MKLLRFVSIFLLAIFAICIAVLVVGYTYYNNEINKAIRANDDKTIEITIERGMGVAQISDYFAKEGIISSPLILKSYMFLNKDKHIEAGYYRINNENLNLITLVDLLQNGTFERKLTFIEGWRIEEYGKYLEEQMGKEYADAFIASEFVKEGYMFPDTYIIEEGYSATNLASWMRNNFEKRVTQELRAKAASRGMTIDEVIILASILEREMNIKIDRPKVAGILIKRWQNDWPLQADATVQYAKGNSENLWPVVTRADLRSVQSPYNTYLNKGLPPAPISNPSLDSIQAVINYVDTPYWFYITGKDGVTHYAETLDQHNSNVSKYL